MSKIFKPITFTPLLILTLILYVQFSLIAKVEVSRASLRLGFSLQVHRYSWANFSCYIENTDSKSHRVALRLFAENSFSQTNVFSDEIVALPQAGMNYYSPVLIENSETYRLDVFIDGKKQPRADTMLLKLLPSKTEQIAVVNSSENISFGSFTQLKTFKKKMSVVYFNSGSFPNTRSMLCEIFAIVMLFPDYENFSTSQYKTLLNYVKEGGIIIFGTPYAAIHAMNTPLFELLPVYPLKTRYIKKLPELKTLIPKFKGWQWTESGIKFLETIPKKYAAVTLKTKDFPIFCWKKYGIGEARFSAVPLYENCWEKKEIWEKILKLSFRHQKFFKETTPVRICLDKMTGFSIPPVSVIQKFFLAYFLVLVCIMFLGFVLKRPRAAWVMSALSAIIATGYILNKATDSSKHKGNLLSFLELNIEGTQGSLPASGYYGFFSTKNVNITVSSQRFDTVISAIPPDRTSFLPMAFMRAGLSGTRSSVKRNGKIGGIAESFELQRTEGRPSIKNMTIRANTARQFTSVFVLPPEGENLSHTSYPTLTYTKDTLVFEPWHFRDKWKRCEYAFLLLPSASLILNIDQKNKIMSLKSFSREALFTRDEIINSLKKVFQYTYPNTNPCIALVEKSNSPALNTSEKTAYQGKRVHIIPVTEKVVENEITIRPEQVILTAGDTFTRMIMSGNRIKNKIIGQGASTYSFKFTIPPVFAPIKPERISVKFAYVNQGGNILAVPLFNINGKNVYLTKQGEDTYYLQGKEAESVLDRFTGAGVIKIEAKQRDPSLSQAEKLRANKWFIAELKISIKGKLPQTMQNMEY